MKVYAEKVPVNGKGDFRLDIRAEDVPARLKGKTIGLARRGNGFCLYPLEDLRAHNGHAPVWLANGNAPAGSSAPSMTAAKYLERIRADIAALVNAKEVIPIWENGG